MARSDPEKRPLTEAAIRLGAELNRRTRRLAECSVGHFRFTVERGAEPDGGFGQRPFLGIGASHATS